MSEQYEQPQFDDLEESTEEKIRTSEQLFVEQAPEKDEEQKDSYELIEQTLVTAIADAVRENQRRSQGYELSVKEHEDELERYYGNPNYDGVVARPTEPGVPSRIEPSIYKASLLEDVQRSEGRSNLFWILVNHAEGGHNKVRNLTQRVINFEGRIHTSEQNPGIISYPEEERKENFNRIAEDIEELTGWIIEQESDLEKIRVLNEVMKLLDTDKKILPPLQTEHQ